MTMHGQNHIKKEKEAQTFILQI